MSVDAIITEATCVKLRIWDEVNRLRPLCDRTPEMWDRDREQRILCRELFGRWAEYPEEIQRQAARAAAWIRFPQSMTPGT